LNPFKILLKAFSIYSQIFLVVKGYSLEVFCLQLLAYNEYIKLLLPFSSSPLEIKKKKTST